MPYDKKKTFDAAESRAALRQLKADQNTKPNKENFYSRGWINGRYISQEAAESAYKTAMATYHQKDKDRKKSTTDQASELIRIRKANREKEKREKLLQTQLKKKLKDGLKKLKKE